MTDYIDVVSHSPILFVKEVAEAIESGYEVKNIIAGYPQFGPYGNTIRLFKGENRGGVVISQGHSGQIEHYDPMSFMLLVQNFVHAGYKFKEDGVNFFDEKGLKSVQFTLENEVKQAEEKPVARKATAKKQLKAEQTKSELEGNE